MNHLSYYNDVTKNTFVSCLTWFDRLILFWSHNIFFVISENNGIMTYWHENDNLRMIYQLHFCFEGFVSDCTNSLPAFGFCFHQILLSQKMTLMKYSLIEVLIKCQSSHMKHRYCKNYNISCQVIYTFNISQYCICISRVVMDVMLLVFTCIKHRCI